VLLWCGVSAFGTCQVSQMKSSGNTIRILQQVSLSVPSYVSSKPNCWTSKSVDCVWNVMAYAQKPDFVFRRNGRFHLSRRERQFSRLLATEVCASAVVMLDTPRSEVVWRVLATPTPFASFSFTSSPVRHHRMPSHFNWTLPQTW